MLRAHSRLLGRQLLPTHSYPSSPRPLVIAHRQCWTTSLAEKSPEGSWRAITARNSPPAWGCRNSSSLSWTCPRQPMGSDGGKLSSPLSFSAFPHAVSSKGYATLNVDGGSGSGSGSGSKGGGGGGGGGNSEGGGGGAGAGAGDEGRWRIWSWYLGLLDTRPILTKAVTSATLTFIGDLFCQFALEKTDQLDGNRIAVMSFLGFGLVGPTLHFWYQTLSKLVTIGGPAGVGIRLILDQFVFSPIFIATFMTSLLTLEGNSKEISAKLKQDWWSAVVVNWQLWIPAQIINFWLVPLKLQVAFANFTALFWNAYLSYKSHLKVAVPQGLPIETQN